MKGYRCPKDEYVAAAQAILNKRNGVNAVQERKALPCSDAFIAANPDKFERLPSPGDVLLDHLNVPYA